jgi:serine/threonine protein kinase
MSGRTGLVGGRYAIHAEFASGGMAAVYFGRLLGAAGFARTVAIKCLHPQFARDPEFVDMFLDEARLAARIRHPNVVQTLDVVQAGREIFLVMDYVHGESLANLLKRAQARGQKVPVAIATKIIQHALFGLEAAHDATNERGEPLHLVHRDMSPHNVLVGADGVARVLDFGIAKAGGRAQVTRDGQLKGKLSYVAQEQLNSEHEIDRRADVYAAAATLWEALTGRRLVQGESDWQRVTQICAGELVPPSRSDRRGRERARSGGMGRGHRRRDAADARGARGGDREPLRRVGAGVAR